MLRAHVHIYCPMFCLLWAVGLVDLRYSMVSMYTLFQVVRALDCETPAAYFLFYSLRKFDLYQLSLLL